MVKLCLCMSHRRVMVTLLERVSGLGGTRWRVVTTGTQGAGAWNMPGPELGWWKGIDIRNSNSGTVKITLPKMGVARGRQRWKKPQRERRPSEEAEMEESREREGRKGMTKRGRERGNRIEAAVSRPQSILLLSSTMTSLCQTDCCRLLSLFSCKNFWNFGTVALLFVFSNYYPIMG